MAAGDTTLSAGVQDRTVVQSPWLVIGASSAGTMFEWYDFYLYGSLSGVISRQFFSAVDPTTGFILTLLAFSAGFAARPFGSLVFGRLGDIAGRKRSFLISLVVMGLATVAVGLLPGYGAIGVAAPVILVGLRLVQGLAVGGEYGGAATYLAEHAPSSRRGLFTGFIQTTATVGFLLSLLLILAVRAQLGEAAFADWGWRIPFLTSALLLVVSLWIRLRLQESPLFQQMKAEGRTSHAPWREAFCRWSNLKLVLIAFAIVAGQAVTSYTALFNALFFLQRVLRVDEPMVNRMMAAALVYGIVVTGVCGWLSDRFGRKRLMVLGCVLGAVAIFPLYKALTLAANPALAEASVRAPVTVSADPRQCSFQFDPLGTRRFDSACDIAKAALARSGVDYATQDGPAAQPALVRIGERTLASFDGRNLPAEELVQRKAAWTAELSAALKASGYPDKADPARVNQALVIGILMLLMTFGSLAYGPLAAALVELFPARIRTTALSLPYHLGNGWIGGFMPTFVFAISAATGSLYAGLWYPVAFAVIGALVALVFLKDRTGADISS